MQCKHLHNIYRKIIMMMMPIAGKNDGQQLVVHGPNILLMVLIHKYKC